MECVGQNYTISDEENTTWSYVDGQMRSIEYAHGPTYRYQSQGCLITKVFRGTEDGKVANLVKVERDPFGNPKTLWMWDNNTVRMTWGEMGKLLQIRYSNGQLIDLCYSHGLLAGVTDSTREKDMAPVWRENVELTPGVCVYLSPIRLVSDGVTSYEYRLNNGSFQFELKDRQHNNVLQGVFDPISGVVKEEAAGKTWRALLYLEPATGTIYLKRVARPQQTMQ
jgi:hypothetical protein